MDRPALAYRCGGSTGFANGGPRTCFPVSPLLQLIQQRHLTTGQQCSLKLAFLPVGVYSTGMLNLLIYFEKMRLAIDHTHFFKR